jgi:uncharacterized cupredoxin-like copper-binding protein
LKLSPSTVTLSKPGIYVDGKGVRSKGGEVGEARLEQTMNPGQSSVLTVAFQEPGTYEMYCPVIGHRPAGMKGEVVVT